MPRRSFVAALVVAVLAAITGGCSRELSNHGPLSLGEGVLGWCTPGGDGARRTLGDRTLTHSGSSPVTITGVSLVNPVDLELLGAVLLPIERQGAGGTLIGSRHSWPPGGPEDDIGPPPTWADRIEAIGTTVEPGAEWNFAVGLESHADLATADAVQVEYRDDTRHRYVTTGRTRITIKPVCRED